MRTRLRRPGGELELEVLENRTAGVAIGKDGEDAHRAAARIAGEDIDGEHALHQRCPIEPTTRLAAGLGLSDRCYLRNDGGAELWLGPNTPW